MKKSILLSVYSLLSASLFAQSGIEFGVRVNPEYTFIQNKSDAKAGPVLDQTRNFSSASFGGGVLFIINKHDGIGMDFLFSREGQSFTGDLNQYAPADADNYSTVVSWQQQLAGDTTLGLYNAKVELDYIKIPLIYSRSTDRTRTVFLNALIGPQINLLNGVSQQVDGVNLGYPNTDITPNDLYRPIVMSAMAALGIGCNLGSHISITCHVRGDYAIDDCEKKDVFVNVNRTASHRFYGLSRTESHPATVSCMLGVNCKF